MTPSPPLCMVSLPIKFTDDFLISTFMVLFLLLVIIFIFIFFFFFCTSHGLHGCLRSSSHLDQRVGVKCFSLEACRGFSFA